MKVIKVIVDKVPEGCGDCDEIESREKGRRLVYECHFVTGFIKNQNVRLPNCPLVVNDGATIEEIAAYYKEIEE